MTRHKECQHNWQPTASPEYVKCSKCNQLSKISTPERKQPTMVTPDQLQHLESTLDNVLTGIAQMIIQDENCTPDTEARLESIGSTIQQAIVLSQNLRKEISNHVVA